MYGDSVEQHCDDVFCVLCVVCVLVLARRKVKKGCRRERLTKMEAWSVLAKRGGLPGAEALVGQQFKRLLAAGK